MKKTVLLGMSGGIDSSVAAMLLLEQGFEVKGITFLFSSRPQDTGEDESAAKKLAAAIGIKHSIVDLRREFNQLVVHDFIRSYAAGQTPFPCAVCNPFLKFAKLMKYARQQECQYIATGHYVQIVENEGIKFIGAGIDPEKDQSFFLWGLKRKLVDNLIFPLGHLYKEEVKKIAAEKSFSFLTKKKESLGLCFTGGKDYREFLSDAGVASIPGKFIDKEGNTLGKHKGILQYTIGQRRGLGLQTNKPLFVNEIRAETNEIVLTDFSSMYRKRIFLHHTHFIAADKITSDKVYKVRIRYRLQENDCKLFLEDNQKAVIELIEPVAMVANGQTAVIYEANRVVGGGFIERSE